MSDLPGPFYWPARPKPLLAHLDQDEHFFLPPRPDAKQLRRLSALKPFAHALAHATEGLNWAVQQPDGSWPQVFADRKVHSRYSGQWEATGKLPTKSCLLALAGYTCAAGTSDRPGIPLKDAGAENFERAASGMTFRAVRLDVDCDDAFDRQDRDALRAATDAVRAAYSSVGLTCSIWTTGGRGIQAVAPCQPLTWHELRRVERHLKHVLSSTLPEGAKADKGGTEGILRLPFGLHPKTGRLGLFIDADCQTLPLSRQLQELLKAYGQDGSELPPVAAIQDLKGAEEPERPEAVKGAPEPSTGTKRTNPSRHAYWESVRQSRPEPGGFRRWLMPDDGRVVYAFAYWHGAEGARTILHGIADETPCRDEQNLRDRHRLIDDLLDRYTPSQPGKRSLEVPEVSDETERKVGEYTETLSGRKDYVSRQEKVYRAYLHARETWGDNVDGGDVCRMAKALYGEEAPASKTVYRALEVLEREYLYMQCHFALDDFIDSTGYVVNSTAFGAITTIGDNIDRASDVRRVAERTSDSSHPRPRPFAAKQTEGVGGNPEVQPRQAQARPEGAEGQAQVGAGHAVPGGQGPYRLGRPAPRNRSHVRTARLA